MTYDEALMHALVAQGILNEYRFIREATPVVVGGSEQNFQALKEQSDERGGISAALVQRSCCYLFGKGVELVLLWGQSSDGKFSAFYRPSDLVDLDLRPEVPEEQVDLVQDACQHGLVVYDAHAGWLREHQTDESYETVKRLLLRCSQFGISFGLERGYHELQGIKKGVVYHEPPHSEPINEAAEKGVKYYQGKGVPRDLARAFKYLKTAAEAGHLLSQYGLGMMIFRGEATKADSAAALDWFLRAAEGGLAQAQHEVSVFFCNGVGCQADPAKAFYWCQKAADQNLVEAVYNLGVFLYTGTGVSPNRVKAVEYLREAASLGHEEARDTLRRLGIQALRS